MGLLDLFKKNKQEKKTENTGLNNQDKPQAVTDEKQLANARIVFSRMEEATKTPAVYIKSERRETKLTDSKFGGIPYLAENAEIPRDSEGNQLRLIAQINCKDIKELQDFPKEGILQFFALNDDITGLNMEDMTLQDTFRIVYYETVDSTITVDEVKERYHPYQEEEDYFPITSEYALTFESGLEGMSVCDYRMDTLFVREYSKLVPGHSLTGIYDLDEEVYNAVIEEKETQAGHKMGGYPFFTQTDPRDAANNYKDMDVLLLQIDSEYGGQNAIMWGDSGVCNFFINREALKKKDFSKVVYNWDCY